VLWKGGKGACNGYMGRAPTCVMGTGAQGAVRQGGNKKAAAVPRRHYRDCNHARAKRLAGVVRASAEAA
jgi:hypothetical protein